MSKAARAVLVVALVVSILSERINAISLPALDRELNLTALPDQIFYRASPDAVECRPATIAHTLYAYARQSLEPKVLYVPHTYIVSDGIEFTIAFSCHYDLLVCMRH
jgi:hypothetical protein